MADFTRAVKKILDDSGCYFIKHGKGDHDRWHSPVNNRNFTVDNAIKSKILANRILKQAGIDKKF